MAWYSQEFPPSPGKKNTEGFRVTQLDPNKPWRESKFVNKEKLDEAV